MKKVFFVWKIKHILRLGVFLFLTSFSLINTSFAQEVVGDRSNLSIMVFSPTNMMYKFNWEWRNFNETSTPWLYKSTLIQPLAYLNKGNNNELVFSLRVKQNEKIHFVRITQKYTSEILRQGTILIWVGNENVPNDKLPEEMKSWGTLHSWDSNGVYVKTSNVSTIVLEDKDDIVTTILFPNILGVKWYGWIILIGIMMMMVSMAFLLYKKQIIKI